MQNFLKSLQTSLEKIYSKNEIQIFGNLILEKVTGFSRTHLLTRKEFVLDKKQEKTAFKYLERLKNLEPIQYVLGEMEFYGLEFKVNPTVLIPRPETEELVEWVLMELNSKEKKDVSILDIGTGSGIIAIALKSKLPGAEVTAMDVSQQALKTAQENAVLNHVEVEFKKENILKPKNYDQKWDIIVSNPPYIPFAEKSEIDKQVIDFEPHVALFSPNERPLLFFHKIAAFSLMHLAPNGRIYFESHKNHARDVARLLGNYGFSDVVIRNDISGNERMVRAVFG